GGACHSPAPGRRSAGDPAPSTDGTSCAMGAAMVGFEHLRLPWEIEDDEVERGGVAPGKQTLTARLPPRIGGPLDPTAAAAPGLGAIEGTGAKPAPPSDDAFAVHLEAAKDKGKPKASDAGDANGAG